jgi:hypothetical protein
MWYALDADLSKTSKAYKFELGSVWLLNISMCFNYTYSQILKKNEIIAYS